MGKVAWIESDTVTWPIIMQGGAHTGTWLAVFNSQGGTHSISQTVTVPECAPKLGVWWKTENTGYGRVHSFNIKVNDVTVGELWEPMIPSDEWCNMTVDLSAYENQTILLSFEKYIGDRGGWTNFYVDDITFQDKVTGSGCEFFEK